MKTRITDKTIEDMINKEICEGTFQHSELTSDENFLPKIFTPITRLHLICIPDEKKSYFEEYKDICEYVKREVHMLTFQSYNEALNTIRETFHSKIKVGG